MNSFLDKVRVIAKYAQGTGVILISTSYTDSPEDARKRLGKFMVSMHDALDVLKNPEVHYVQEF